MSATDSLGDLSMDNFRVEPPDGESWPWPFKDYTSELINVCDIYMTNIALVIHFKILKEYDAVDSVSVKSKDIQENLGRFLRLTNSIAHQHGLELPVFGLVETLTGWAKFVDCWAADQDWHRGDFVIISAGSADKVREWIRKLISDINVSWGTIKIIEPLLIDQYIEKLRAEMVSSNISDEHSSLLDTIMAAWQDDKSIDKALNEWIEDRLEDAERERVR